ncbi:MAG: lipid-A-disaccharide synthase, partial [Desulfobaccales bacterium]
GRGPRPLAPPPDYPFTILIVAGEASGDAHGARLVGEIRDLLPGVQFTGIGGEALAAQGVKLLARAADLAVVGLTEVAGRLPALIHALREISRTLRTDRPALAILIDFPDFNFLVARLCKWQGVPVMYYISPQVWAWRRRRVRTIARFVARMVVIFPFEEEFYRQHGVPVTFVGHPFMETLPDLPPRESILRDWGLDPRRFTLALLPGSRGSEIERHLPTMLAAAQLVRQAIPEVQFLLPLASTAPRELVEEMVASFLGGGPGSTVPCPHIHSVSHSIHKETIARASSPDGTGRIPVLPENRSGGLQKESGNKKVDQNSPGPPLKIITGQAYAALKAAHVAVVASGTVTVEAALAGTPTVIIYRLAPLTFQVAKLLIRVDHIGMANLLAGEGLFPELIQDDLTPENLAREVLGWVQQPPRLENLRQGLARVLERLGPHGASRRAAQVALNLMTDKAKRRV